MTDPLASPIGMSMRSTEWLHPEDSLDRSSALLRNTAYPLVPIVDGDRVVGAVSETTLAEAIAAGKSLTDPCTVASFPPPTILPTAYGAEGLRRMIDEDRIALLVLDHDERLLGIVGPSDLTPQAPHAPTPPSIGGMATPFGVYLTTGTIHGGAAGWALVASGAMLFGMFLAADQLASLIAFNWKPAEGLGGYLAALFFLASMRLLPISGTHAAEHMVVHAIERGEPLEPAVVRRMPRVHPRCGTNLAVGGAVFLGLFNVPWTPDQELRLVVALLATVLLYRPLGAVVQFLVTTKPPTEAQIASGIRAGKELLERYRMRRGPVPSPLQRILNSGMLHVAAGSTGVYLILKAIVLALDLPIVI